MGQPADIFISYKAEDRPRVKPLVDALEADGFSIWWDAHIGGGVNWRRDIEEHLDAAQCVIVAWTKRSVGPDGEFVRDEAGRARRRGTYLPVLFEAVEPPLGFGEVQSLSLKGWKGDRADARYHALVHGIRNQITGGTSVHHPAPQPKVSRRTVVAGGAGIATIAVAGAGGWLLLKPASANARRIAVLPFANLSGDAGQAYFSDGIAEELRSALSRMGMEVVGRTSSDAVREMEAQAAAARLAVANILTGSVRRSSEMIRINAQLISGNDGVERWAQSYDRAPGDAIKIQSDIAARVAEALSVALGQTGRAAIGLGSSGDSVAQDLLLRSRQVSNENEGPDDLRKGLALADAALARDPAYADAYVEKARVLINLAGNYPSSEDEVARQVAEAETAAKRAATLAPRLGSAYAALGRVAQTRLNFRKMLDYARQALALSPDDLNVLSPACGWMAYMGFEQEGLRLTDRMIALDPLNGLSHRRKAEVLFNLRRYPEAMRAARKAMDVSSSSIAHLDIGNSLLMLKRPAEALAEFRAMPADDPFRLAGEAFAAARTGDVGGAERTMVRIKQLYGAGGSYQYAEIHAQLGHADQAFAEFENAIKAKDGGLLYLKLDPFLDPIRGDPRYNTLLRRLSFPI